MARENLGSDKTVADDMYAEYVSNRDAIHGDITRIQPNGLPDFTKKRVSMFDTLVKAVSTIPDLKVFTPLLKETKIFNFEQCVSLNLRTLKEESDEKAEAILKEFYDVPLEEDMLGLPFGNTCVVTPDSATLLHKVKAPNHAYLFLSLAQLHGAENMVWLTAGIVVRPPKLTTVQDLRVSMQHFYVLKYNGKYVPFKPTKGNGSVMILPILGKVLALIMQLNTPDRFILEVAPKVSDVRSNKYVPRSHQRPEYVILHPHSIRHYMKTEADVEGHKRRGHERRAHLRRYPDDPIRFPNAHGKTIQIPALWIGRTEATVGNKKYKVIL